MTTLTVLPLSKPLYSKPCNGCGVCCIAEQCSVSVELFAEKDRCPALEWEQGRYWCGLMRTPGKYGANLPNFDFLAEETGLRGGVSLEEINAGYYRTLIGQGRGCDADD